MEDVEEVEEVVEAEVDVEDSIDHDLIIYDDTIGTEGADVRYDE